MDGEELLAGGNMGPVNRLGDEVLRPSGPWTANVHRLLERYEAAGITEAPRSFGFTADGRERLTYLPGTVAHHPMPDWIWDEAVLGDAARLMRRLHDASGPLAGVAEGWRSPVREPAEVVCHNDFAPYNLVFTDGRLTGVIDFDYCSPGPRLWDLAYLAYRLAPLAGTVDPGPFAEEERAERVRLLVGAYGASASLEEVAAMAVLRLRDLADFSDAAAEEFRNPDLHWHAAGYRADAARLAGGRLS